MCMSALDIILGAQVGVCILGVGTLGGIILGGQVGECIHGAIILGGQVGAWVGTPGVIQAWVGIHGA